MKPRLDPQSDVTSSSPNVSRNVREFLAHRLAMWKTRSLFACQFFGTCSGLKSSRRPLHHLAQEVASSIFSFADAIAFSVSSESNCFQESWHLSLRHSKHAFSALSSAKC